MDVMKGFGVGGAKLVRRNTIFEPPLWAQVEFVLKKERKRKEEKMNEKKRLVNVTRKRGN